MAGGRVATLAVLAAVAIGTALANEDSHHYVDGQGVTLWLNKVGPYHNPQETYSYYTLPFCRPSTPLQPRSKWAGLSEILDGTEFYNSDILLPYKQNLPTTDICSVTLDDEAAEVFAFAVSNHYWYQMYFDGLPIWGMVGEIIASEEVIQSIELHKDQPHDIADSTYLFTHKKFSVHYNGDRVIEVNLTSEAPQEIAAGKTYRFSYSVEWTQTDKQYEDRFSRYLDYSFFEHQIHWFSIFNSFMMVIFLCGLVALILMRTLRQDYAKYMREDDELDAIDKGGIGMGVDESGWKQVHGEVFRRPPYLALFSALIGTGYQLVVLISIAIFSAITGSVYSSRFNLTVVFVLAYGLTSFIAGYTSGAYYRSHFYPDPSPNWIRTTIMTASLLPGVMFGTMLCLNAISLSYGTINTVPFSMMVTMVFTWLLVSFPLVVAGAIVGRRWSGKASFPCRVNSIPRPIPPRKWFSQPLFVCMVTGVLPFGSIFMEMYFIFTSFWNYKFYYVYGFMLLVYVILIIVTSCVTIVAVYFFLNSEDHRWPWLSFLASASTAIYVYIYAFFYFLVKTDMSGLLQTSYYFAYMAVFCGAIAIMCGTIGFFSSSVFVNRIYRNIKVD